MSDYTPIDDRDSAVVRTGTWVDGGTEHEHDSTVSSSTHEGDFLTVSFTGTEIIVYGTYDSSSSGVITSYAMDGGPATDVTHTSSGGDTYQQKFWDSGTLSMATHHLVLTMVHVNTQFGDGEGTVWIDYFNVANAPATSSTPGSTTNTHSSSPPIGAIVGGTIGGVALIIISIALLLWYRARKRRALLYDPPTPPGFSSSFRDPAHTTPGPYQPPNMAQALGSPYFPGSSVTALAPGYPSQTDISSSAGSGKGGVHLTVMGLTGTAAPYPAPSTSSGVHDTDNVAEMKRRQAEAVATRVEQLEPLQHQDSGIRGGKRAEIPPMYTPD